MSDEKKYSKEEIQELENKKDGIECILRKHYLEEKLQQIRNNKEYVGKKSMLVNVILIILVSAI